MFITKSKNVQYKDDKNYFFDDNRFNGFVFFSFPVYKNKPLDFPQD